MGPKRSKCGSTSMTTLVLRLKVVINLCASFLRFGVLGRNGKERLRRRRIKRDIEEIGLIRERDQASTRWDQGNQACSGRWGVCLHGSSGHDRLTQGIARDMWRMAYGGPCREVKTSRRVEFIRWRQTSNATQEAVSGSEASHAETVEYLVGQSSQHDACR